MPEREPLHPEIAAALRAYEIEMRDGTERSQKRTLEILRITQKRIGNAALMAVNDAEKASPPTTEAGEQQLAAS